MRARSSQFVFLLLLLCSVQLGEDYTRLLAAGPSVPIAQFADRSRPAAASTIRTFVVRAAGLYLPLPRTEFSQLRFTMGYPALAAAAIAHHTSLRRG